MGDRRNLRGDLQIEVLRTQIPCRRWRQKEIVVIEDYQVTTGARAVHNYRPHIPIHPDWPMVELK